MAELRITWKKSAIGHTQDQRAALRTLGLRRLNQTVVREDSPSVRGNIVKLRHLIVVEEAPREGE
jgi:large subunit ribosomal protein L30